MKALAIDTAISKISITARNGDKTVSETYDIGMRQSEVLLPAIISVMEKCALEVKELDFLSISQGPGSFTGLRIGYASMKAIEFAADKPLFAYSVLDVYAEPFLDLPFIIISAMDAHMEKFYLKAFDNGKCIVEEGDYKSVVAGLLGTRGLNYGRLPKGLLKFHRYESESSRTPFEEHLVEGALYAKNAEGKVQLHFTVSPEHRSLFETLASAASKKFGELYKAQYEISFSEQKSSTDTIAANADGTPFRNADGSLLFRPGGHGALIENLNDIDADVIFVKTIDNVSPDSLKAQTVENKQLLAGLLVSLQARTFAYLEELEDGNVSEERMQEMLHFLENDLHCQSDTAAELEGLELLDYLYTRLNRPIRVCGMVRNVGEPGGGPFIVYNADGSISLQILESSQIDMSDPDKKRLFEEGTHFNPVDLVCGVRDFAGEKFHLPDFVDPNTGFISHKSKDGKELLALELPGLWNGAMSDWNTVFVEVPLATFNPVKTVNDLFRSEHQL